nr:hypothetical protein [Arthrobacter castelli]
MSRLRAGSRTEAGAIQTPETPYADNIRQEVAEPTGAAAIAVGTISTYDDVNSILLAGRADLIAMGRTYLYDPQWTLHAAAEQEYQGDGAQWIPQFRAGGARRFRSALCPWV